MSKQTKKKGRNGNGNGRSKSNNRSNGNGRNGNSRSNGNGDSNGKKQTARKPAAQSNQTGMIVRRNSTTMRTRSSPPEPEGRAPMAQRVENMGGTHVAAAATAGMLSTAAAVAAVGKGWIGAKTSSVILMGAGAATTALGWYGEHDHVMMAGAGVAAAGAVSMANQLAVDGYDKVEKRAAERKAKKDAEKAEEDKKKKLAEARTLLEEEDKKKRRNARIVILDENGDPAEYDYAMREAAGDDFDDEQAE